MRHYLSINDLSADETLEVLRLAQAMKQGRGRGEPQPLLGESWALLFSKSSTRTRVSFEVGLRELGAKVLFLSGDAIQMGRGEPITDTARVLGRMLHGAVIRTYAQQDVVDFANCSGITTINALTDAEHPCQILADLMTMIERLGSVAGRKVVFIGDGACNVPISWIKAAYLLGFELVIAAPKAFQPDPVFLHGAPVHVTDSLEEAVRNADVLYTDVWVSMGKESEKEDRVQALKAFQINAKLVAQAKPGALVMHCLPAYRGLEITAEIMEAHADTIFSQAENRLHAQKALVTFLRQTAQ